MNYYGYRYYAADAGRWINRDPIKEKGGVNVYAMVGNLLIGKIDILGLSILTFSNEDPGQGAIGGLTIGVYRDALEPLVGYEVKTNNSATCCKLTKMPNYKFKQHKDYVEGSGDYIDLGFKDSYRLLGTLKHKAVSGDFDAKASGSLITSTKEAIDSLEAQRKSDVQSWANAFEGYLNSVYDKWLPCSSLKVDDYVSQGQELGSNDKTFKVDRNSKVAHFPNEEWGTDPDFVYFTGLLP